jgi:hypothetical protein
MKEEKVTVKAVTFSLYYKMTKLAPPNRLEAPTPVPLACDVTQIPGSFTM